VLGSAFAQSFEYTETQDHPLVSRYAGSVLLDIGETKYAEVELPGPQTQPRTEPIVGKGKLSWRVYASPEGKSAIEVYRNYESALAKAGFKAVVTCTPGNCRLRGYQPPSNWANIAVKAAPARRLTYNYNRKTPYNASDLIVTSNEQARTAILASRTRNGQTTYIYVAMGERVAQDSAILPDGTKLSTLGSRVYTFVEVVEEDTVETGKVEVSGAEEIRSGLEQEGRKAIYGIYFDTAKAEVKAESQPQLEQIAALLAQEPKLSLYVVGHTDSTGSFDANLDLSKRRAQAVVAVLTGQYKVAATRLTAQGVGPLAPVASNATEEGKALNRRVELVVR
jgi:outer membrane protein OmpA-like peptidoglycan-associated protein